MMKNANVYYSPKDADIVCIQPTVESAGNEVLTDTLGFCFAYPKVYIGYIENNMLASAPSAGACMTVSKLEKVSNTLIAKGYG